MSHPQIEMRFPEDDSSAEDVRWLGLVVNNRNLFSALETGWYSSHGSRAGVILGTRSYAYQDDWEEPAGHQFPVLVKFNPAALPGLQVAVSRQGKWALSEVSRIGPLDEALYWPGVLPTFAIEGLAVATEEEQRRLRRLTRVTSNVDLPDVPLRVDAGSQQFFKSAVQPPDPPFSLVLPDEEDQIHGALSMAVWAVPRISLWMDILTAALAPGQGKLQESAAAVEASWWRFPPWASLSDRSSPTSSQECLWLAATQVFRCLTLTERIGPRDLTQRIAEIASESGDSSDASRIGVWHDSTQRILRSLSTVSLERWRDCPVGIALQLVLARPEPVRFKGWFKDRPNLPPAIAWSAAALCGLWHGYRRLDREFRGKAVQREVLAIRALQLAAGGENETVWPTVKEAKPTWHRDSDKYVLSWGERDYAWMKENPRGRWIASDFQDERVMKEAKRVARDFSWQCFKKEVNLNDQLIPLAGSGSVELVDSPMQLLAKGKIRMTFPDDVKVEEILDIDKFRQLVAVEAGSLPEPPISRDCNQKKGLGGVPGLVYVPGFLSPDEEDHLVKKIDSCPWQSGQLSRRVQHYGWRYDYRKRKVDTSMHLGPLPNWVGHIAKRLVSTKLLEEIPDQVIVNEYLGNQGIHKHVDHRSHFADGIVMISLLEGWEMIFRGPQGKPTVTQVLEPGSATVMHRDARFRWTHEIPRRKFEPGRVKRNRRISLTFRKVQLPKGAERLHR